MDMIYERNLQPMKLAALQGTRQNEAVRALAARLGMNRQQMRKILINNCDMMTLENLGPRLEAADAAARGDAIADALSLPHLVTATGLLDAARASELRSEAEGGVPLAELLKKIREALT